MPKLSDTKIRNTKPREKPFKLFDSDGLFIIVRPDGMKWWRQRYYLHGKEQMLSLGTYPDTSLTDARARGRAIRVQAKDGINPSVDRKQKKEARRHAAANTFKPVALAAIELNAKARRWEADTTLRVTRRLELHAFPWLGSRPVSEITEDDVLACLRRMEGEHLTDTARRLLVDCQMIFRYARREKLITVNPIADILARETLTRTKIKHHAALKDPAQVGALLRAIDAYHGGFVARAALRFLPLVFTRPGELQWAKWDEFDFHAAEWRIPAERMKMREQHIVPLSKQAMAILRELHPMTGPDGFVFPQVRNAARPISENTINVALRACGYTKHQQTAHGFRTVASTLLNELGFNKDWIERQLAHGERDKSRGSYNGAEHLADRRKMMQSWADYLDELRVPRRAAQLKLAS